MIVKAVSSRSAGRTQHLAVRLAMAYLVAWIAIAAASPLLMTGAKGGTQPLGAHKIINSPDAIDLSQRLQPPSVRHWLGTDDLGRDQFARLIHGAAVSLAVGGSATAVALLIGVTLGAMAGYWGGVVDWIVSRVVELVLCFPFLVLLLGIVTLLEPSIRTVILAVGLTSWTTEARIVRGEILRLREMEFSEAARASGASDLRVIFRHLIPHAMAPVFVTASFGVGTAILLESALSYLGFGVPLPTASWGSMLSSADDYLGQAWWLALFPGLAIFLTVASFNIIGEHLRDRLDPAYFEARM